MKAKLKNLVSPDVDLATFSCEGDFSIFIQAEIGSEDEAGVEIFDLQVLTPGYIFRNSDSFWAKKGNLLVKSFDLTLIWESIEKLCAGCKGNDWEAISNQLSIYMHSEYEGMEAAEQ